eukprot:JP447980.1.p2 GENE.JP447980.1~~JP447980.1.p2  ORF type:complete len:60 (+),score=30.45 JP447980.1:61-240(+)
MFQLLHQTITELNLYEHMANNAAFHDAYVKNSFGEADSQDIPGIPSTQKYRLNIPASSE